VVPVAWEARLHGHAILRHIHLHAEEALHHGSDEHRSGIGEIRRTVVRAVGALVVGDAAGHGPMKKLASIPFNSVSALSARPRR